MHDLIHDFGGKSVLFVMAADPEYGPELRARITPLMTGIGPVEAAVVLAEALAALSAERALPDLVVCLGSAGSRVLKQGGVYALSSVQYRDMDATALGFAKGEVPMSTLPIEVPLATVPGLETARCATGGSVVSGGAYDGIDADLVEMETYAVWRACHRHGIPVLGLRGISDGVAPLEGIESWTDLLPVLDTRLAEALDTVDACLRAGQLQLGGAKLGG